MSAPRVIKQGIWIRMPSRCGLNTKQFTEMQHKNLGKTNSLSVRLMGTGRHPGV